MQCSAIHCILMTNLSVCLSVCPSSAGTVSRRMDMSSRDILVKLYERNYADRPKIGPRVPPFQITQLLEPTYDFLLVLHSNTRGPVVFPVLLFGPSFCQSHVFIFRRPVTCRPYISSSSSSFICLGCYRVIKLHGGMSLAVDRFIGPSPTGH